MFAHIGDHLAPGMVAPPDAAPADPSALDGPDFGDRSVCQVFSNIARANVLQPFASGGGGQGRGSGWVTRVGDENLIVTNHHVVDQAAAVHVSFPAYGKRKFEVEVAGDYPEGDLALLRMKEKADVRPMTLADSDRVRSATKVLAVGYPLGQTHQKMTMGVVAGHELLGPNEVLQTDAAINPGNSGGPLVAEGTTAVLGVNSSIIRGSNNVGYAIPANSVKTFLRNYAALKGGDGTVLVSKPVMGMFCQKSNEQQTAYLGNPGGGYYVSYVLPGSLMHNGGLRKGDQIYAVNGHKVSMYGETTVPWSDTPVSVSRILNRLTLGDEVNVSVYRLGAAVEIKVTFEPCDPRAVRPVYFPYDKITYEAFAGMVVSDLTQNHVGVLMRTNPLLSRFLMPENLLNGAVVVTHVFPGSTIQDQGLILPGSVITKVNDTLINSVSDYRSFFRDSPRCKCYSFETDMNSVCVVSREQVIQGEAWMPKTYNYKTSELVDVLSGRPGRPASDGGSDGSQGGFQPRVGTRVAFSNYKKGPPVGKGVVTKVYPSGKTVKLQLVNGDLVKQRVSHCSVDELIEEWGKDHPADCGCGCGDSDDDMQARLGLSHLSVLEYRQITR